ncbi:MAG: DUF2249 domain-containing protein [Verrucomicrobiae bacterium]|nr:DUF2249 domain-containing protein [Verrucomicrobiae bacterium]MDW8307943.1 DUF2249 domain-containing protein [Verrucomicrobiales bacterium]
MTQTAITLDVRADFRAGNHPCDKIHAALGRVREGRSLRLIVPFEPVPLYEVARRLGLSFEPNALPGGDWEVVFSRCESAPAPASPTPHSACNCGGAETAAPPGEIEVDARGLEPPQPMVKILEALIALPRGGMLRARTDRRPVHLYPVLEARGFTAHTEEQPDGSFVTHIRRS